MTARSVAVDRQQSGEGAELHFGHFAGITEYREVNRELIRELFDHLPNPFVHVDVATGTGLVPQLLIEAAEERGYAGRIVGLDLEPKSIELARATTPSSAHVSVEFVQGDARDVHRLLAGEIPPSGADSVSIHDAIHEIDREEDQRAVYGGMAKLAKAGAVLSSNSSFTTISMKTDTSMRAYGEWKLLLVRLLNAKRNRGKITLVYRSPDAYKRMIEEAGFAIIHERERVVRLSKRALHAISCYPKFIEGMCRDLIVDRDLSIQELSHYMRSALDRLRFDALPRVWHEVLARRVPAGA
ncbi:MAG: class I SAM-dependent methyltransferase [Actinobacteria bacterium]|nr:class I SAM-dependent methyltransferase [Actinomycetota bacterium]